MRRWAITDGSQNFFERWLIEGGYSIITSTFLDENAIEALREREQEAYVTEGEIVALDFCSSPSKRRVYRASEITPIHVRAWLDQFEDNTQKRLMFSLLQHIRFYNEITIREKIGVLHKMVQAKIAQKGVSRRWDSEDCTTRYSPKQFRITV